MSAHTPGPWHTRQVGHVRNVNNGRQRVCSAVSEADARLIAAAPDMLAALKVALEWIDGDVPEDSSWGRVEMIRAAIAKAEGTS